MPFPGQCVAPVEVQDPTGHGRVSAQRNNFRVTSALPEPDSLLTRMALVLRGAVMVDKPSCAPTRNWSVTCQAKYTNARPG